MNGLQYETRVAVLSFEHYYTLDISSSSSRNTHVTNIHYVTPTGNAFDQKLITAADILLCVTMATVYQHYVHSAIFSPMFIIVLAYHLFVCRHFGSGTPQTSFFIAQPH